MDLKIDVSRYNDLLTTLSERIDAGEQVQFVPFELFSLHTRVTSEAADLMGSFIMELQTSVTQLQEVQSQTIDRLMEVVAVLNETTAQLEKQRSVEVWTGNSIN